MLAVRIPEAGDAVIYTATDRKRHEATIYAAREGTGNPLADIEVARENPETFDLDLEVIEKQPYDPAGAPESWCYAK